jgi:hypothetical protein
MRHVSCYSLPLLLLRGASSPALQNRAKCSAFGSSSADKLRRFLFVQLLCFRLALQCRELAPIAPDDELSSLGSAANSFARTGDFQNDVLLRLMLFCRREAGRHYS